MKKLLSVVLFLLSGSVFASPFLVGDVASNVTECRVFMDNVEVAVVPATVQECRYDVQGISNGLHRAEMTAIIIDPVWGTLESVRSSPLDFTRPGLPTAPGLRLAP